MLQLNMEQECYDFLKWHRTTCLEPMYDWTTLDDYHNIQNANAFETVAYMTNPSRHPVPLQLASSRPCPPRLTHVVYMTLLKAKLLTELIELRFLNAKIFKSHEKGDPQCTLEGSRQTRQQQCKSTIILASDELMNGGDPSPKMHELRKQVDALYDCVNEWNPHFWGYLVNPRKEYFSIYRPVNILGSPEEAQFALLVTCEAWHTHRAFSYIRMKHHDESLLDQFFGPDACTSFSHISSLASLQSRML